MMTTSAREEILSKTRAALGRRADSPIAPLPASARVAPRVAGDTNSEIELLRGEVAKLGGSTRRMSRPSELTGALKQLVETEAIKKAVLWQTQELNDLGVGECLSALGVEIVSPYSDKHELAECDLGVTGVDAALPETGTLLLCASSERPRRVSLLPRVHLAVMRPSALRSDVGPALAQVRDDGYWVFITGPSRTSDIELTTTIGVHGPKALYVLAWEA